MNKKLIKGGVILGIGCSSCTWLLLFMRTNFPRAFYSMLSQEEIFRFGYAPIWLWAALAVALILVVKGARTMGHAIRDGNDDS